MREYRVVKSKSMTVFRNNQQKHWHNEMKYRKKKHWSNWKTHRIASNQWTFFIECVFLLFCIHRLIVRVIIDFLSAIPFSSLILTRIKSPAMKSTWLRSDIVWAIKAEAKGGDCDHNPIDFYNSNNLCANQFSTNKTSNQWVETRIFDFGAFFCFVICVFAMKEVSEQRKMNLVSFLQQFVSLKREKE